MIEDVGAANQVSQEKDNFTKLFLLMKEEASFSLRGLASEGNVTTASSFMKLAGFSNTEGNAGEIRAKKTSWQAAGAPLKRKKVEQAPIPNPWAALQTSSSGTAQVNSLIQQTV